MRSAIVLLLVAACGGGSSPPIDPDAGTCPMLLAPPTCKTGGLATVYLAGTWTFTGTRSDDNCLTAPPTETPVNSQFSFTLGGCKWDQSTASMLAGSLDETIARKASMDDTMEICVDTTGALRLQSTSSIRCIPTSPNPRTITMTGTLTR